MGLAEDDPHDARDFIHADDEEFVNAPPSDDPASHPQAAMGLAEDDQPDARDFIHADDEELVNAPPSDGTASHPQAAMGLAEDDPHDTRDFIHPDDAEFVNAPPSDDPAGHTQVDTVPCRLNLAITVDSLRAAAGLRPLSAAMYRRRRASDHQSRILEDAQRREVAAGQEEDEPCKSETAAADDSKVTATCAYCGCNFSFVAPVDRQEQGRVCGVCGLQLRVYKYNPVPQLRVLPENAEERWKGWLPW